MRDLRFSTDHGDLSIESTNGPDMSILAASFDLRRPTRLSDRQIGPYMSKNI
jgi:hypothetical protein